MDFMSYYRDVYLKSDDWKNLRDSKIARHGKVCSLCFMEQQSVDVHHLKYKNIYNVNHDDLRVLCRECHNKIHSLLNQYPKMKTLGRKLLWQTIKCHLGTESEKKYFRKVVLKRQNKLTKKQRNLEKWQANRKARGLEPFLSFPP